MPSARRTPEKDVPYRPWPSTDSRRYPPASQPTMQRSKNAVRKRTARDEEKRRRGKPAVRKERSGAYASDLSSENAPLSRKAFSRSSSIKVSRFKRKDIRRPFRHARGVPHAGQNFASGGNAAPGAETAADLIAAFKTEFRTRGNGGAACGACDAPGRGLGRNGSSRRGLRGLPHDGILMDSSLLLGHLLLIHLPLARRARKRPEHPHHAAKAPKTRLSIRAATAVIALFLLAAH